MADDDGAPSEFLCPISKKLMREAVTAADEHTYDREPLEQWLEIHDTSPKTGIELANKKYGTDFRWGAIIT